MILRIFAFASWSLLKPILDRFWFDFGPQSRSKIDPKRVPKGVGNHGRFCMPLGTSKNQFFGQHGPNMTPTWPPRRPQVGAKIGQKFVQKRPRGPSRPRSWFWDDFSSILCRFWIDFGQMLGRIWISFGWNIGMILGPVLCRCCVEFSFIFAMICGWLLIICVPPLGRACNRFWANSQLRSQIALHMYMCSPTLVFTIEYGKSCFVCFV